MSSLKRLIVMEMTLRASVLTTKTRTHPVGNDAEFLALGKKQILSGLFFSGSASFEPEYLMT